MNRPLIIAAIGLVIVIVAIGLNYQAWQDEPSAGDVATPEAAAPSALPADDAASFDVVRVGPEGDAVFAGRARPRALIRIKDGDTVIGEVTADSNGEWVFVPDRPLRPGSRQITLEIVLADGTVETGGDPVLVVVPERPEDGVLAMTTGDGVTVLQKPQADGERGMALAIDAVDYNAAGQLVLSGRADEGSFVHLYIDTRFLGRVAVDALGRWSLTPNSAVAPGTYILRADQIGPDGRVAYRVSIPFSRAELDMALKPGQMVIVQPGNSLWRLARRVYGEGDRFTVIFQANKDQIANPDRIFPGQVFTLPEGR